VAKRWYVVQCYATFEKKVAQAINENAVKSGLSEQIDEVLVPSESIIEVKRGKKIIQDRSVYPGYVLIKTELTDDIWHMVNETPKVTGFLGSRLKPSPISESEVARIMQQSEESAARGSRPSNIYEIGQQIRVSDGPFSSFNGTVEEVDTDKGRLRVAVSIFGRLTPVDLEFSQVEKV
jgi:transcriptional antiterminator NusG